MNTKLIVLLLFCLISGKLFSQPDTLYSGIYQTDTLRDDTIECYPYRCPVTKCHVWQLPLDFDGVVHVTGDPADFYEIIVLTENDSVHMDTCTQLFPFAGGDFLMYFDFGANAQIMICGPEDAAITIIAKPDTSQPHPPLKPPFLLLDTLCGITYVDPIKESSQILYYALDELKKCAITGIPPTPIKEGERVPGIPYKEVVLTNKKY